MAIDPKRVKEIFLEAAELSDEAARAAYLDKACGADAGVRERVEALLRSHDPEGSFLGAPAAVVPDPDHGATQALTGYAGPGVAAAQTTGGENGASEDEPLTFLAPPTRPDALGRIGHYEVLQVLGRGGFGIVFRAFDEVLQRVVALKVMAPQLAATSPARRRFLREARSSAQVRHENVVQVYEVAEQPLPYLAMEFIPGETLQQRLDRVGPLDVLEVLRIGRQIAEGLAAAHATELIHRDIKPGNVLIEGGQHKVKITDFGLARAADDASISQSGIIAGTPMYMAPEQAKGETLDQRADLFSLGSVLYQMAAGRPPFRANGTVAVLKRVAEDTPRDIREIIPETPQWLCDIIAKLHAKGRDDRYQSAREVADVLADCEAQLKANARLKDYSRIPRSKPQRSGRRKWVAVALAALLLTLLASWFGRAAILFFTDRGELELLPEAGLVSVILLQNNEGVIDGDKLHAPVTDWLDMKKRQVLHLPPGRYQLNVGTWPAGTHVSQWEVTTSGPLGSNEVTVPVINSSAIVTVANGRRVTLRAKLRTDPARPAPVVDAGVQRIAALPAAEQVEEVRKELMRRNPGFDGKVGHKIEDGVVTEFRIVTDKVTDIAPIRVWSALRVLDCRGTSTNNKPNGLLADLTPLKGMNLAGLTHLDLRDTKVTDAGMACFKDCKDLRYLQLDSTQVTDKGLAHFKDCKKLTELHLINTLASDAGLVHFQDCKALTHLNLGGTKMNDVGLANFKDCKGLTELYLFNTQVSDAGLVHFQDCKALTRLNLAGTKVSNVGLAYFKDCKELTYLHLDRTPVGDAGLANFKGMRLTELYIDNTATTDLTPLQGMPLADIRLTPKNITKGLDILRDMKGLKTIGIQWDQSWPAAEFWERYDKGEFGKPTAPFTDADVKRIAALPAAEQVEEVRKELMKRNPGFDGEITHKIEGDVVTELRFVPVKGQDAVIDLSPVRALAGLTSLHLLDCYGLGDLAPLKGLPLTRLWIGGGGGDVQVRDLEPLQGMRLNQLALMRSCVRDLEPLKGMPLTHLILPYSRQVRNLEPLKGMPLPTLNIDGCDQIEDFTPLIGMPLTRLWIGGTQIRDLESLKGMKLTFLNLFHTRVRDLEPLKGMPLKSLLISDTGATDLSSLKGMPLEDIRLTPKNITQGLDILRDMKTLTTIGTSFETDKAWPAAEFWERYDKGEFK
jgi:serine/threonine protein kinase/Leucine-rich repeat (LRR) protein